MATARLKWRQNQVPLNWMPGLAWCCQIGHRRLHIRVYGSQFWTVECWRGTRLANANDILHIVLELKLRSKRPGVCMSGARPYSRLDRLHSLGSMGLPGSSCPMERHCMVLVFSGERGGNMHACVLSALNTGPFGSGPLVHITETKDGAMSYSSQ